MVIKTLNDKKVPYYYVKQAVSPQVCALLVDYLQLKKTLVHGAPRGDFLKGVYRAYGDPMMEVLLSRLQSIVSEKTGFSLWPTLSFYYVYEHGQSLERHCDRQSCEWVAGLCIGADSKFQKEHKSWPLVLEISGKPVPISLSPGDVVIFPGASTWHWREAFLGEWYMSAIFAYVDQKGPWHYQKYDRRKALGKPHIGMFRWAFGSAFDAMKERFKR